jgi:hypothetical protein
VSVPLAAMLASPEAYATATREVFGPVQIAVEWTDAQRPLLDAALERMEHHLTAGIVSNDVRFVQRVLGATVNGTQYVGARARTTGAPQNHWFGPAGDPRGAGIGTPEAIKLVWSCHREIISDVGPVPEGKGLAKLAPPKEVEGYTSEYQEESDVIARFFTEYVHALPEGQAAEEAVSKKMIADTFREWKRSNELGMRGSPEDVIKRVESQFGAFKRGGWANFKLGIDG